MSKVTAHVLTMFAAGLFSEEERKVLPDVIGLLHPELDTNIFGLPEVLQQSNDPKIVEIRDTLQELGLLESPKEGCD